MMRGVTLAILALLWLHVGGLADEEMKTRAWNVRPDFLSLPSGQPADDSYDTDPFAVDDSPITPVLPAAVLESAGITFPPGSSASFDPKTRNLVVRNTPENLELVDLFVVSTIEVVQKQIFVLMEHISLPHDAAVALLREQMSGELSHANALREKLSARIESGDARLVSSSVVVTRSGQRAKTKSITEEIYPIEWESGRVPSVLTGELKRTPASHARPNVARAVSESTGANNSPIGAHPIPRIGSSIASPIAYRMSQAAKVEKEIDGLS